jgi:hypothetical protein
LKGEEMMDERYPLEKAVFGPNDKAMAESWLHSLELIGPENVRARLSQTSAGPGGAILIGMVQSIQLVSPSNGSPGTIAGNLSEKLYFGNGRYFGHGRPHSPPLLRQPQRSSAGFGRSHTILSS